MTLSRLLNSLPDNSLMAAKKICKYFFDEHDKIPQQDEVEHYDWYLEMFSLFQAYCETKDLKLKTPSLKDDASTNIKLIHDFFIDTSELLDKGFTNLKVMSAKDKYLDRFGGGFFYEFSDGDISRIQELINELRDSITKSKMFEQNYRERLLKKLESLQKELHKKMRSLDKFWEMFGEAGVAFGKFGSDAKPFVDRLLEIAHIGWRTQARAEELPSGSSHPLLGQGEKESDE